MVEGVPEVSVEDVKNDSMTDYSPTIFEDKEKLRPTYIPDMSNIVGRTGEIEKLENVLQPIAHGDAPGDAAVLSKPGTGKTLCVKNVVARVRAIGRANDLTIAAAYINCDNEDTETQVAYSLTDKVAKQLGVDVDLPENGVAPKYYYKRLWSLLEKTDGFIPILDEVDKLGDGANDVIKTLADAESDGKACFTAKVVISNKTTFYDNLDSRVQSRFSNNDSEMVFSPYDAHQLRDILHSRKEAFKDDVLSDDVVPLCAAFASQEHGDARKALDLLLAAGNRAQNMDKEKVTEEDVRSAHESAVTSRKVDVITTSKQHSQYALFALAYLTHTNDKGGFSTGEIRKTYKKVCFEEGMEPHAHQTFLDHLKEWAEVEITENRKTSADQGAGRHRKHTILMDPEKVMALVQQHTLEEMKLTDMR